MLGKKKKKEREVSYIDTTHTHRVKFSKAKNTTVFARGWGDGENGELLFNGHKISVTLDE